MATATALGILVPDPTDTFASSITSFQSGFATVNSLITADRVRLTTAETKLAGVTLVVGTTEAQTVSNKTLVSPIVTPTTAAAQPLIVRGLASQTGNLQEWQNSAGTSLASIGPLGTILAAASVTANSFKVISNTTDNSIFISHGRTDAVAAIIRGAAGQTANLQEWQNSGGTAVVFVTSGGSLRSGQENHTLGTETVATGNPTLTLSPTATNRSGLVVRGAASQTANLQEWQNSGGTLLSGVDSAGRPMVTVVDIGPTATPLGRFIINVNGTLRGVAYYA